MHKSGNGSVSLSGNAGGEHGGAGAAAAGSTRTIATTVVVIENIKCWERPVFLWVFLYRLNPVTKSNNLGV